MAGGEFAYIAWLRARTPADPRVLIGPGDDCAALAPGTRPLLVTTDMLTAAWNFLAGTILPEAAGLAVVGAIFNYARHRPFMPLVGSGLAFLSVTAIWKLVQAMAG